MKLNYLGLLSLLSVVEHVSAAAAKADTCAKQWGCLKFTSEVIDEASCATTSGNCKLKVCMQVDTSLPECAKSGTISHVCDTANSQGCPNSGSMDPVQFDTGEVHQSGTCNGATIGDDSSTFAGKCEEVSDVTLCQEAEPGDTLYFIVKDGSDEGDQDPVEYQSGLCEPTISCFNAGSEYSNSTIEVSSRQQSCDGGANLQNMERIWKYEVPSDGDTCFGCGNGPDPTDPPAADPTDPPSGSNGDPHFKTWKNEHFEYHGQCDMVLTKDDKFADGLGLNVQIRTKVIRYWSYIKNAAIRIGDDILEVEGNADANDSENRYWFNLEYQGKLDTIGGFPVSYKMQSTFKRHFEIDLSSKYPGQKIVVSTYKEFVRVDFVGGTEESFGNTVGMIGNFKTGETLARDGSTVLNDFWELGNEWQVMPFEHMLFHETSEPQFPNKCIEPEDPQGARRRTLLESTVSEAQAEAACAHLKDAADRKDCVYDILATQDLDMVGAY